MGLILRRLDHWRWRVRYWWFDTREGERAKLTLFFLFVAFTLVQVTRVALTVPDVHVVMRGLEAHDVQVHELIYDWVVQLIIAAVVAAVSYAMRPKMEQPAERDFDAPVMQDGTAVKDYGGTVWIDEPYWLAHRMVGKDKIKTKGSKK